MAERITSKTIVCPACSTERKTERYENGVLRQCPKCRKTEQDKRLKKILAAREPKICPVCFNEFPFKSSRKYCNVECSKVGKKAKVLKRLRALGVRPWSEMKFKVGAKIKCEKCGSMRKIERDKRDLVKGCDFCKIRRQAKKLKARIEAIHPINCKHCNKAFIPKQSNKVYCVHKCAQAASNKRKTESRRKAKELLTPIRYN